MRSKKMTAIIALSAGVALTAAACSTGPGEPGEPESQDIDTEGQVGAMDDFEAGTTFVATEPLEISMLYRDHPNYPVQSDWLFNETLEANNNVTFDMVNVPLSDYDQRRNILLAAGDAPDIIPSTYVGAMDQYVPSGVALPISQYTQYMPHYEALVAEWELEEDLDRTRQHDGEYYVLPGLLEEPKPQYSLAIRADLWEEAGLTLEPETWDEFAEQLATIEEEFPDLNYVYSERWSSDQPMAGMLQSLSGGFGTEAGWSYGDGVIWNGSEYVLTAAQPEYQEMLRYLNGLMEDGLLDPESLTQSDEQAEQKFASGSSAVLGANDQSIPQYQRLLDDAGVEGARVHQLVLPAGPAGNMVEGGGGTMRFESGLGFSSSMAESDTFLATLQFVDWLYYSEEGLEFAKWGVEGETFTVDGDGTRTLMENIDMNGLNPSADEHLQTDYGFSNGVFMPAHGSTTDLIDSMTRDDVVEWKEKMNEREVADPGPGYLLDDLQQEQSGLQATALEDLVNQASAAFILGQRDLDDWDTFVSDLESAGGNSYVETINEELRED